MIHSSHPRELISASRIPLDPKVVARARDGAPIQVSRMNFLPQTGIESLDDTAQRVNSVAEFAPEVVNQTSSATFRGGLYGGICGLIIGCANQGFSIIGDLFARRLPAGLVVITLYTGVAAAIGGILGFYKSSRQNAEKLKTLLFQGQFTNQPSSDTFEDTAK